MGAKAEIDGRRRMAEKIFIVKKERNARISFELIVNYKYMMFA